jgi:hypothetical protein
MSFPRLTMALTALNIGLVLVVLVQASSVGAGSADKVLRAQEWELIDASGQVRSSFRVEESGEVVLRLIDQTGTIRVKLGAGADGSGLVLLDNETEPGVQMLAGPDEPTVKLFGKDGEDLVLTP